MKLRVAVVDDEEPARQRLLDLLDQEGGSTVCGPSPIRARPWTP